MKKVFIDPGHGGKDSGAVGQGLQEKNVVLSISKKLEIELKRCGIEVMLSRNNDTFLELSERTYKANKWGADVLVSIHCNDASNKNAQGLETYCYKFKYRKLADCVHSEILKTGYYTKDRGVKEANQHITRESNMQACLVELGFIGNTQDSNLLKSKENIYAIAIAKGICEDLGILYKGNDSSIDKDKTIYNIITGGFGSLEKANDMKTYLQGITGYHMEIKGSDYHLEIGGFTGRDKAIRKMESLKELTNWWMEYKPEGER